VDIEIQAIICKKDPSFQVRFEQLEDPFVLVRPGRTVLERVVLDRADGDFLIFLAQLDQALGSPLNPGRRASGCRDRQ
jgi:hypothetical protein